MPKYPRKPTSTIPTPVKIDSRICFAINYFTSEADADRFSDSVIKRGITYNGGWFDGMACGRDRTWDYTDDTLGPLFAVTD